MDLMLENEKDFHLLKYTKTYIFNLNNLDLSCKLFDLSQRESNC